MNHVILYCRPGFEKECAGEVQDKANKLELYGFPRAKSNTGYVVFEFYQQGDADKFTKLQPFSSLIFARQMFAAVPLLTDLPQDDRISPILEAVEAFPVAVSFALKRRIPMRQKSC